VDGRNKSGHDETRKRTDHLKRRWKKTNPEQERKHREEMEQVLRALHTWLRFWTICNKKACRRSQACVSELRACEQRHWPLVPQEVKDHIHAELRKGRERDATARQAPRAG
jgi:hypothetical protein